MSQILALLHTLTAEVNVGNWKEIQAIPVWKGEFK